MRVPTVRDLEKRLAGQPTITVPTMTLDGETRTASCRQRTGSTAAKSKFVGGRRHRVIPNVGHNLPQEDPTAFANAVWESRFEIALRHSPDAKHHDSRRTRLDRRRREPLCGLYADLETCRFLGSIFKLPLGSGPRNRVTAPGRRPIHVSIASNWAFILVSAY